LLEIDGIREVVHEIRIYKFNEIFFCAHMSRQKQRFEKSDPIFFQIMLWWQRGHCSIFDL
jgi:hypothetical protein